MSILEILEKYHEAFLSGISVTLQICSLVWAIGIGLGLILGYLARASVLLDRTIMTLNFIFSSIPVLIILFWLHYPLQNILGIEIHPFISVVTTLAILNVLGVSLIVSRFLKEIPREYIETARVSNISRLSTFKYISFPILTRLSLPSILSLQIQILHLSLFGSLISVEEIFKVCQQVNAEIYQPVEVYSALAIFFLVICLPINLLAFYLQHKYKSINQVNS